MTATARTLAPIDFMGWINDNRHLLKPPVGNRQIWADREFMVTVVGGPNSRQDFHINEGEEFFYQVEGDMILRVLQESEAPPTGTGATRGRTVVDIPIRQGQIFLLPAKVPHSPQRPAGTVGVVIERRRLAHELDGLVWVCDRCQAKLYEEFFHLEDIVKDLLPVIDRFYANPMFTACRDCGQTHARPARPAAAPAPSQPVAPEAPRA